MKGESEKRLSRTQIKRFKCVNVEKKAIKDIMEMAIESMTCRQIEIIHLESELWEEIIDQHDLDRSKQWVWDSETRSVREKHGNARTRGFGFDPMEDSDKGGDK